ncbi:hypothetical protein Pelo_4982 [Pelomyxa schiedti]|nr:hypothetical protein Pelo_4982 [Pelomyxa schiedti]
MAAVDLGALSHFGKAPSRQAIDEIIGITFRKRSEGLSQAEMATIAKTLSLAQPEVDALLAAIKIFIRLGLRKPADQVSSDFPADFEPRLKAFLLKVLENRVPLWKEALAKDRAAATGSPSPSPATPASPSPAEKPASPAEKAPASPQPQQQRAQPKPTAVQPAPQPATPTQRTAAQATPTPAATATTTSTTAKAPTQPPTPQQTSTPKQRVPPQRVPETVPPPTQAQPPAQQQQLPPTQQQPRSTPVPPTRPTTTAAAATASSQLLQPSLPKLRKFDWRIDVRSASDTMARMSVPCVLVQMEVETPKTHVTPANATAAAAEQPDHNRVVTFELTKESLNAMLEGKKGWFPANFVSMPGDPKKKTKRHPGDHKSNEPASSPPPSTPTNSNSTTPTPTPTPTPTTTPTSPSNSTAQTPALTPTATPAPDSTPAASLQPGTNSTSPTSTNTTSDGVPPTEPNPSLTVSGTPSTTSSSTSPEPTPSAPPSPTATPLSSVPASSPTPSVTVTTSNTTINTPSTPTPSRSPTPTQPPPLLPVPPLSTPLKNSSSPSLSRVPPLSQSHTGSPIPPKKELPVVLHSSPSPKPDPPAKPPKPLPKPESLTVRTALSNSGSNSPVPTSVSPLSTTPTNVSPALSPALGEPTDQAPTSPSVSPPLPTVASLPNKPDSTPTKTPVQQPSGLVKPELSMPPPMHIPPVTPLTGSPLVPVKVAPPKKPERPNMPDKPACPPPVMKKELAVASASLYSKANVSLSNCLIASDELQLSRFLSVDAQDPEADKPASMSTVIRDFWTQMELLLLKHKAEIDGAAIKLSEGAAVHNDQLVRAQGLSRAASLRALNTLSNILVLHSQFGENLVSVCDTLVKLAERVKHIATHVKPPSSKDKEEAVQCEPDSEDFPFYFCLKTLHLCITSSIKALKIDEVGHLNPKIREFLFEHLHFTNKYCIRKIAAENLGVISGQQLDPVVRLFTGKLIACKSDDQLREYVTYQNAAVHLHLGLSNSAQVDSTNHYMSTIATAAERISRGVLRKVMCTTLGPILRQIMISSHCPEFEGAASKQFVNCYHRIYDNVKKWAKTEKARIPSINLLGTMLFLDPALLQSKLDEFLPLLFSGFKEKKTEMLQAILSFITNQFQPKSIPSSYVTFYKDECDFIVSKILPSRQELKGSKFPVPGELQLISDILLAMGRKSPYHIADVKHINLILKGGTPQMEFPIEARGVIFRVLALISTETPENLTENMDTVRNVMQRHFEDLSNGITLSMNILLCFPNLCQPEIRDKCLPNICKYLSEGSPDVSSMAHSAVVRFMTMDPSKHLPTVVWLLVRGMQPIVSRTAEEILQFIKPLCSLLDMWQNHMQSNNLTASIPIEAWVDLRACLEGLCLLLFCYNEPVVWTKALFLLDLLTKPAFVEIETGSSCEGHFSPSFRGVDTSAAVWFQNLSDFLRTKGGTCEAYGRAVSWCWDTLNSSKTWLSGQVPHWKNLLRFMLLSTRVKTENDPGQIFMKDIVTHYFTGTPDMEFAISDSIPEIHPSCMGAVMSAIMDQEKQQRDSSKRKRKEQFYHQEPVITLHSRIMSSLPRDVYSTTPVIREAFRAIVLFWNTNPTGLENHHYTLKCQIAGCIEKFIRNEGEFFLRLSGDSTATFPIRDPEFSTTMFLNLKRLLGVQSGAGGSKSSTFEQSVVKTVALLIQFCEFSPEFFKTKIYPFLLEALDLGPHMQEDVMSTLVFLLQRCTEFAETFVERSFSNFPPVGEPPDLLKMMSPLVHMQALVKNFSNLFDYWASLWTPAKMACLTMFHMAVNPCVDAQKSAIEFANFLALATSSKPTSPNYTPSVHLPSLFYPSVYSYNHMALRYSASLADSLLTETPLIFSHFDKYIENFDTNRRSTLLNLLPHWARNFSSLVKVDSRAAEHVLQSLFSISSKCFQPELFLPLQEIWQGVMYSASNEVANLIVEFVVTKSVEKLDDRAAFEVCSTCLLFVCRTNSAENVISNLVNRIHSYPAAPLSPEDFLSHVLLEGLPQSEVQSCEKKAFSLLSKPMYENFEVCGKHLPLIFQNACILFSPPHPHAVSEADFVLNSALLSVITPHPGDTEWSNVRKQAEALLPKKSKWSTPDLQCLVEVLAPKFPDLRESWADLCLDWAVQLADEEAAIDSVHLFTLLCLQYNLPRINKLVLGLLKAVIYNQDLLRDAYFEALLNVPLEVQKNWQCWRLLGVAGGSMCVTCNIDQYLYGCRLLKKVLSCEQSVKLAVELDSLWNQPLDMEAVILRGLSYPETVSDGLWLCDTWIKTHQNAPVNLVIISVLVHTIQCITKSPVTAAFQALQFIHAAGNETLMQFEDVFTHMDLRDVPLQKQPDPHSLLSEFFTVFCGVFPEDNHHQLVLDTLLVLLHRGQKKWRVTLLYLMTSVLTSWGSSLCDLSTTRRIVEVIVYFSQAQETETANAATALLPFVLQNIPEGIPVKYFEYLRPSPPEITTASGRRFLGETEANTIAEKLHCGKKVMQVAFGLHDDVPQLQNFTTEVIIQRAESRPTDAPPHKNAQRRPYAPPPIPKDTDSNM